MNKFFDLFRSIFISPEMVIFLVAMLTIDYKIGYRVLNTIGLPSAPLWTMISAQIIGASWITINSFKPLLFGNNEAEKNKLIDFPKRFMIYNRMIAGLVWFFISIAVAIIGISLFLGGAKYYGLILCVASVLIFITDALTLIFAGFILTDILSQNRDGGKS